MTSRKLGRFQITDDLVNNDWRSLLPLFSQMVVVRCEHRWEGYFQYTALSDLFAELGNQLGEAPEYVIEVTKVTEALGHSLSFKAVPK